jgi:hypothetical protein
VKKGRLFALVGGIFGIIGVVFLGVGVVLAVSSAIYLASAERAEGRVVALNDRPSSGSRSSVWYPTVEYTVDGRVYAFDSSFASSPPAYSVGDPVPVAYDPADPSDARIVSFGTSYLLPTIFGGMGVVFAPLGGLLFAHGRRIRRQHEWLLRNGREVWAQIVHVGLDFNVKVNGRHPYVVHATWYDERTGRTHAATSDILRHDPGPGLRGRTHVRVLYDPAAPDRNLVDLGAVR